MKQSASKAASVDAYISTFPVAVQERLQLVRQTVRRVAPDAQEKISYGIPTFALDGNIIHYAAYRNHVGIYPGSAAVAAFRKDLAPYRTSKGTIQLPLHAPIPCALIEKIVRFRLRNHSRKRASKSSK